jgi:hypothetical protein
LSYRDRPPRHHRAQEGGPSPSLETHAGYPFSGTLVDGKIGASWLLNALAVTTAPVSLCSAYLRSEVLAQLLAVQPGRLSGRVLTRWQFGDLLSGASDVNAYTVATNAGFEFAVRLDYHGKVFSIQDRGLLVGSANATLSGFGLKQGANEEVCTIVPPLETNLRLVDGLFAGAIPLDANLFDEIRKAVLDAEAQSSASLLWPPSLLRRLSVAQTVDAIFLEECLWSVPSVADGTVDNVVDHDRQLLGLPAAAVQIEVARTALRSTRMYMWLTQKLKTEAREMYFGELSEALQRSLLDDPGVHRRDAKVLLQNLLTWCEQSGDGQVLIDRPRYSQRIRLV